MNKNINCHKLKQLRISKNMNQADVAGALGVGTSTYSNYETGECTPGLDTVYKLAGIFNVSLEDLMHIFININREESFDAPTPTDSSKDLNDYLEYTEKPCNKDKLKLLNQYEKKLLYYFEKLSISDKEELIEISKIKYKKNRD